MKAETEMVRIDAEVSVEHKKLLEEAARLIGFPSLTEYVMTTMVAHAEVVKTSAAIQLSERDQQRIKEIMSEPTELSDSFLRASQRCKDLLNRKTSDG